MNWTEQEVESRQKIDVSEHRAALLDKVKKEVMPVLSREAADIPLIPIDFQPVRSPNQYEAEFGVKGNDVIFHFWPWNYHVDQKFDRRPRAFKSNFKNYLEDALTDSFELRRVDIVKDEDMNSYFVKAKGYASNQFHRELCIRVCERLHKLLEG